MKEIDRMVRRTMTMAVTAGAGGIGMGSTHKLGAGEGESQALYFLKWPSWTERQRQGTVMPPSYSARLGAKVGIEGCGHHT